MNADKIEIIPAIISSDSFRRTELKKQETNGTETLNFLMKNFLPGGSECVKQLKQRCDSKGVKDEKRFVFLP